MGLKEPDTARPLPDLTSWLAQHRAAPVQAVATTLAGLAAWLARTQARGQGLWLAAPDRQARRDLIDALGGSGVAYLAFSDDDAILTLDAQGCRAMTISPIGGPGEISANIPIGFLFTILAASPGGAAACFLRPGDDVLAAGYVICGTHTALVFTAGDGVEVCRLDSLQCAFHLSGSRHQIDPQARDIGIDMSNYRHWHHPVRLLVDDCIAGTEGPRGVDYRFCGGGSLVGEAHRILAGGGVFIDPADHRVGRQSGGVGLIFEAFALALIMENAGGAASDTRGRILSRTASDLRQKTPLVFGSAAGVKLVDDYHVGPAARLGEAALFGRRGLYRK